MKPATFAPATVRVRTGGGWHLYFVLPPGVHIRSGAGVLGRGLDVRAAAPDEPIRCLLIPNAAKFFSTARFAIDQQPRLAVDVGKDAIWVVDLPTNELLASAWVAQVTATPAMRQYLEAKRQHRDANHDWHKHRRYLID